jgi:uncharacterized protein YdhG (YjbR/CyaY superfamily)
MISKAASVQAYMAEVSDERKASLERLRALCRRQLKGYEECMEYGMPCYKRNGAAEVAFASQKQYVALYVMKKDVVDEFRAALPGAKIGKGCIRFTKPEKIDFEVVGRLLQRTAESAEAPC